MFKFYFVNDALFLCNGNIHKSNGGRARIFSRAAESEIDPCNFQGEPL